VIKELVIFEAKTCAETPFCQLLAKIVTKHFEDCLKTRAVFILIAFLEHDKIKGLLNDEVQSKKKLIQSTLKSDPKLKGLAILAKKL